LYLPPQTFVADTCFDFSAITVDGEKADDLFPFSKSPPTVSAGSPGRSPGAFHDLFDFPEDLPATVATSRMLQLPTRRIPARVFLIPP
jgi:hypothetical protein